MNKQHDPELAPDFEGAKRYALQRLENELAPNLTYHSVAHTRDQVVPAAEQLAQLEGVGADDAMLLSTAAWFHDLGYIERHENNEIIGVHIAQEVLPTLRYSSSQIQVVCDVIMATRVPQTPHSLLEEIIADADLVSLSATTFLDHMLAIRQEFAAYGNNYDDKGWYSYQFGFLQKHDYFTASARQLYNPQKQINIALVERLLAEV
jgi:uncharacterized protein